MKIKLNLLTIGIVLLTTIVTAQTVHDVAVSDFKFTPSSLTIAIGETVKWSNVEGNHNVDGSTATYPSNSLSFGNPSDGTGSWTYSFVFTEMGTFEYECGVHGISMPGTITVTTSTGVEEDVDNRLEKIIFPNPANTTFTIRHSGLIHVFTMYNTSGQAVKMVEGNNAKELTIQRTNISSGIYLCVIESNTGEIFYSKLLIE